MGCVTATAKRRRKQAVGGYMHLPPQRRPRFPKHSKEVRERREERALAMQGRKGRRK